MGSGDQDRFFRGKDAGRVPDKGHSLVRELEQGQLGRLLAEMQLEGLC